MSVFISVQAVSVAATGGTFLSKIQSESLERNKGMIDKSLSAQENASNILNNQFGRGNWNKGPRSDFSKIVKWINRSGLVLWPFGNMDRWRSDGNGSYYIPIF